VRFSDKRTFLVRLHSESLDDAHTGDGLLHVVVQYRGVLTPFKADLPYAFSHGHGQETRQRRDKKRQKRQFPVENKHVYDKRRQHDDFAKKIPHRG
jgi:hypothetical protein